MDWVGAYQIPDGSLLLCREGDGTVKRYKKGLQFENLQHWFFY